MGKKVNTRFARILFGFLLFILIYILGGFVFTILRSNAHYDYFVEGDYWKGRCTPENNYEAFIDGTPGARWCLINGQFTTEVPTRTEWYQSFYFSNTGNYNGGFISTIALWPLHFIGIDMIHFKSIAGIWALG